MIQGLVYIHLIKGCIIPCCYITCSSCVFSGLVNQFKLHAVMSTVQDKVICIVPHLPTYKVLMCEVKDTPANKTCLKLDTCSFQ